MNLLMIRSYEGHVYITVSYLITSVNIISYIDYYSYSRILLWHKNNMMKFVSGYCYQVL